MASLSAAIKADAAEYALYNLASSDGLPPLSLPASDADTEPFFDGDKNQISDLESVGIIELLEQDDRPVFIVDLKFPPDSNPVFYNKSLQRNKGLRDRIYGLSKLHKLKQASRPMQDWEFLQWQRSNHTGHSHSSRYAQMYWVATTVRERWRIISGVLTVQNIVHVGTEMHSSGTSTPNTLAKAASNPTDISAINEIILSQSVPTEIKYNVTANTSRKPPSRIAEAPGPTPRRANSTPEVASMHIAKERLIDRFGTETWDYIPPKVSPFDWTVPDDNLEVSEWISWFRNYPFHETRLGPIQKWSPALRRSVVELMADPGPAAIWTSGEYLFLYNEEYKNQILGKKHPVLALSFHEVWGELGALFDDAFKLGSETGLATCMNDAGFYLDLTGHLEERFMSLILRPVEVGYYNTVYETTKKVVAERRMPFLLNLGALVTTSREPKEFWSQLLNGLEAETGEVPFALLYSMAEDETSSSSSKQNGNDHWILEGSVGYPEGFSHFMSLSTEEAEKLIPSFKDTIQSLEPTLLQLEDGTLGHAVVDGVASREFGDSCNAAICLPIRSTGEAVLGFLILGLNPRRYYDSDYRLFAQLLSRLLATAMASTVLFEEQVRQNRIAADLAAMDRDELSDKLALRTQQALENEHRFRRMADLAPVGMFHFDASGMPIYCNSLWYKMTEHPRGALYPMSWYNVIHPDDHPLMDVEWAKLGAGLSVNFELRLRKPFVARETVGGEPVRGDTWIIAAAYPEKAEDGTVTGILGCLTDISRQKWAEDFQTRRMKEALELKRQQENFIDMTSHEMRNPLSAIIQSADWVVNSLAEFDTAGKDVVLPSEVVASIMDAVSTVVLCSSHQKRIIDDVLTLSKLDSNLLVITPVDVQPAAVIRKSLQMFDGELQQADVAFRFEVDKSYEELKIDWVKLDPSRVLQVLINLLTNAIKFTQPEAKRRIEVTLKASREPPIPTDGVRYVMRDPNRLDLVESGKDWGAGELVYLEVRVKDTGRGLDEHERKLLFQRFSQTSPRTHISYGGSGLGLFISRELTELQGGEIGVLSEAGVGSTFAFFVKARRTIPPETTQPKTDFRVTEANDGLLGVATASKLDADLARRPRSQRVPESSKHVLIVEDNLVNQKVLSKQLKSAGCIVSVANHGLEALQILQSSIYWKENSNGKPLDVILMDLEMPVMDGLTCVKEIRRLQASGEIIGHVPVIAVTANARSEQILTAKNSGMDGVVTKPFRIPELIPEMERLVGVAASKTAPGFERSVSAPAGTVA